MSDYKSTIKLPETTYPMRANLRELEGKILEYWQQNNINKKILENSREKKFTLQYGPPYANGDLHMGSGANMILKDIALRMKNTIGYQVNTMVGHDCHGLPIELRCKSKEKSIPDLRKNCRDFANNWVEIQQNTIQNMGFLNDSTKIYKTMDNTEKIYQCFSKLLLKGLVNIHKKPLHWSIEEYCVIADADIEYKEKESQSIDVALEITNSPYKNLIGAFLVIWTTTPWSLMDNRAVAFNPEISYVLCEMHEHMIIIAKNCLEEFQNRINMELIVLAEIPGTLFEEMEYRHPFLEENCPVLPGNFVTDSSGTGLVHIAPAHGEDDFQLGQDEDLEVKESIDYAGYYYQNVPILGGKHIFFDEEFILDKLEGKLLSTSKITHSYPYSARTNTPLIFRSVEQIFLKLKYDRKKFQEKYSELQCVPEIIKNQFAQMLEGRTEWCISRNRSWGVPLCLFIHRETRTLLIDPQVQQRILEKLSIDPEYFFNEKCLEILDGIVPKEEYEPYIGILEVWFDSGCVWYMNREHLGAISDLYLEGKDQTRGWFQSSLWLSFLLEEEIPYKSLLMHGFVVDSKGQKMSKSKGNVVDFKETVNTYGREIVRLWLFNTVFTNDMRWSDTLLSQSIENYRKFRNVLRYLTSVAVDLPEEYIYNPLENYYLCKLWKVLNNYENKVNNYEFNSLFHDILELIQNISGDYFNSRKDQLYCDYNNAKNTQKTMFILLKSFVIMLAPILPFTTEELYMHMKDSMNYKGLESVHLETIEDIKNMVNSIVKPNVDYSGLEELLDKCRIEIDKLKGNGTIKRVCELKLSCDNEFLGNLACEILGFAVYENNNTFGLEILKDESCERCHKKLGKICGRCLQYTN